MKPKPLTTERLYLRSTISGDAESFVYHYTSDSYSSQYLARKPHSSVEQTADFLNEWGQKCWEQEAEQFAWVVSLRETNEAVGVFLVITEGDQAEIHYGLGQKFWRQGLTTEFTHAAIEWLMSHSKLQRLWTLCDFENAGSIRILESAGFKREGILKDGLQLPAFGISARDGYIYSKTKAPLAGQQ